MKSAGVGKIFEDGQIVFRQGEVGECLVVVQDGEVEVIDETAGRETILRIARTNDIVGEEAVFERERRATTVRARGTVRVLTITRRHLLRRINEDPSLAFNLAQKMSRRIRELSAEVVKLRHQIDGTAGRA